MSRKRPPERHVCVMGQGGGGGGSGVLYAKLFEKWVTRLFDVSRLFLAQKTISEFVQQQIGIWIGIWVEILGYFFSLPPSLSLF